MRVIRSLAAAVVATSLIFAGTTLPVQAAADEWVTSLQTRLNELGCSNGRPDGVRDARTRTAVVRFQSANRVAQTGRFTKRTRTLLRNDKAMTCNQRPKPARSGKGRRIVISQVQNWVWIVGRDGLVQAQGGMVDDDWLPQRTFFTGAQCGKPARSMDRTDDSGRLWLHYFVRFALCRVGFHQIPVKRQSGKQIHPSWYVGTDYRESHGCIRLSRRMAKEVWRFTGRRTKVVVVR